MISGVSLIKSITNENGMSCVLGLVNFMTSSLDGRGKITKKYIAIKYKINE